METLSTSVPWPACIEWAEGWCAEGGHDSDVGYEDYGIARAYRDTGRPVELPVYGTGRIPVQERHCGTSEMLVPVDIDLENNTVPVPIPVPIERILLHPP